MEDVVVLPIEVASNNQAAKDVEVSITDQIVVLLVVCLSVLVYNALVSDEVSRT